MREPGVRLGVDYGVARIGVAKSDPHGIMAFPVTTITNSDTAITELTEVILSTDASVVYLGNPINLQAQPTKATENALTFARQLVAQLDTQSIATQVRLVDERFTTKSAQGALTSAGLDTRSSKSKIDQAAAVVILEHALDLEKNVNGYAGVLVTHG